MFLAFEGMNVFQFIVWFFIYSFLGWCMECVVIKVQLGYWENRGFAKLPFCIIYGFGILGALVVFQPFAKNIVLLYIAGCVGGTAFEYVVAMVMIKLFGELWWNYDHKRFNYKGILCLQSSLAWGAIAVLLHYVFNIRVKMLVMAINPTVCKVLGIVLLVSYSVDFTHQFFVSIQEKKNKNVSENALAKKEAVNEGSN